MLNDTQIPAPRVPIADKATPTREWFRFFSNLYDFIGLRDGVVPTTSGGGLTAGPLAVGEARPVWLRRTITAGASGISLASNSAAISAYLEYVP